jgi:hypothetical protein
MAVLHDNLMILTQGRSQCVDERTANSVLWRLLSRPADRGAAPGTRRSRDLADSARLRPPDGGGVPPRTFVRTTSMTYNLIDDHDQDSG